MAGDVDATEATSSRGSVRVDGRCLHRSLTIAATSLGVEAGESVVTARVGGEVAVTFDRERGLALQHHQGPADPGQN